MRLVSNPTALRQLVINLPLGAHQQILVWLSAGALIRDMKITKDVIESTGNLAIIIIKFS